MPQNFKETYESFPEDVKDKLMQQFHYLLASRGYDEAWRLQVFDHTIKEIVELCEKNGAEIILHN